MVSPARSCHPAHKYRPSPPPLLSTSFHHFSSSPYSVCVSVYEGGVKLDKKAVLVGVKSSPVGYVEIYIGVKFFSGETTYPFHSAQYSSFVCLQVWALTLSGFSMI